VFIYIHLPQNVCSRAYPTIEAALVVPVPRFAATMGHCLIKTVSEHKRLIGSCGLRPMHEGDFRPKKCSARSKNWNLALRSGRSLFESTQKSAKTWITVSSTFWHWEHMANSVVFFFFNAGHLLSAVLAERWPQVCRVKITCTLLLTNCFVSTTTNSMKCLVNWISLRIQVC